MEGHAGRAGIAAKTMVNSMANRRYRMKRFIAALLRLWFHATSKPRKSANRIISYSYFAEQLKYKLPISVVVLGRISAYGTRAIHIGEDCLLYPDIHFETHGPAIIEIGEGVVVSRGVHLVAMEGITIGRGSMIGEYTSIRDANHRRREAIPLRDAGHVARPIVIGNEVWIGRGVTIIAGVVIGDGSTVGANAVVTHDVPARSVVAGVPARPIRSA